MRVCFVFDRCSDALYKNKSLISSDQKEYQCELKRIYHSVQDNTLHLIQSGNPQNKAPQAVCPYTHSKQRTTGSTALYTLKTKYCRQQVVSPYTHSKQITTGGKFLYALITIQHRRYVHMHTQNKAPQPVPLYNTLKTKHHN